MVRMDPEDISLRRSGRAALTPRDPQALAGEDHDLIVVGAGVLGIMVALEAVRRGLRPLVIERGDFGAATSYNSLRIIHGGIRYLQSLDLPRFRESVAERRWFLRHFPDLVHPLPCLMPLYGEGIRRPAVLRIALAANRALSLDANLSIRPDRALPPNRVLDPGAARVLFPGIDTRGLRGAALWHDAFVPDAPRLMVEALRWACARGARVLNYMEARRPVLSRNRLVGMTAADLIGKMEVVFRAPIVINATGPWAPFVAQACGIRSDDLFHPLLAWNVAFDRPPPASCAIAVKPRGPRAQTYFLVPWKGILLAGTGYAPWNAGPEAPHVARALLRQFIADLNDAVPGLDLAQAEVARVFAGILPAERAGSVTPATRDVIRDHGAREGPAGLFSLSGVKLTTGRHVADKALRSAVPAARPVPYREFPRPAAPEPALDRRFDWMPQAGDADWLAPLRQSVAEEGVEHLDDLLLRRSCLGDNISRALALAPQVAQLFDWDQERQDQEIKKLRLITSKDRFS